jgi:hypothetical protein
MITIETLKAAGLTDAQIVRVIECEQEERLTKVREQNRIRQRNQRARNVVTRDVRDVRDTSIYKKEVKEENKEVDRGKIPPDWQPQQETIDILHAQGETDSTILPEAYRFRNHSIANGRVWADPDAGFLNWMTSPYRQKGKSNGSNLQASACDRRERQAQRWDETLDGLRRFGTGASRTFGGENVTVLSPERGS